MGAYRLVRGGRDLGRVTIDYVDMWHFAGRFSEPMSEFAVVKHLFEEYSAAEGDSSRAVWQEIVEPGICLEPLDGGVALGLYSIFIQDSGEVSGRVQ